MIKFILVLVLTFGAFCAIALLAPSSWGTAFTVGGKHIPYIALGVCLVGYIGWKKIGS